MLTRRPVDRSSAAPVTGRACAALLLAASSLAGCGNKGDLYLAEPDEAAAADLLPPEPGTDARTLDEADEADEADARRRARTDRRVSP